MRKILYLIPSGGAHQWRGAGGSAENQECLPYHLSGDGCGRHFEAAAGEAAQQQLCISRPHRRADCPGQRAPYAPPSAGSGRTAGDSFPRPSPYLRHAGTPERRGCENRVWDAGPLLGRVHTGHLRPRHHSGAEESSRDHGGRAGGIAENYFYQNRVFRILKARF